jgi:catechol 2,3-dioxygenase-like lactoylglutathione lyase family enzyme
MAHRPKLIPELMVLDFHKSLDFYTRLASFEVVYERPEEAFAMLGIEGARLMIEGATDQSRTWLTGELQRPFGRGINLQIEVRDVEGLYQNFVRAQHPIYLAMEEKWYRVGDKHTGNKQFLVQDPDGYLLRFFEDLGLR